MSKDITLLEEISEQDLAQSNGGVIASIIPYFAASRGLGNPGAACTYTVECVKNCSNGPSGGGTPTA